MNFYEEYYEVPISDATNISPISNSGVFHFSTVDTVYGCTNCPFISYYNGYGNSLGFNSGDSYSQWEMLLIQSENSYTFKANCLAGDVPNLLTLDLHAQCAGLTWGGILVNGNNPINTTVAYDEYGNCSSVYHFEMPPPTCGNTFTITPTSINQGVNPGYLYYSNGANFGYLQTVDLQLSCDIQISSFSGSSQKINPSTGGNVNISGTISENNGKDITWTLNIAGKTYSGTDKNVLVNWDGKDAGGSVVAPGEYSATLTAMVVNSNCSDKKTIWFQVSKTDNNTCDPLLVDFGSSANVATGGLSFSQNLFSLKGGSLPATISLAYDSLAPRSGPVTMDLIHNFQKVLQFNSDGSILYREWNRTRLYTLSQTGDYLAPDTSELISTTEGYTLTDSDGTVNIFEGDGKIINVVEGTGDTYSFAYTANAVSVTDNLNHTTTFSTLNYNSINPMTGSLSTGWNHTYEIALQDQGNGNILFKDGQFSRLYSQSGSGYQSPLGDYSTLVKNADGTFTITEKEGMKHNFDQWGRIISRTDRNGITMAFAYASGNLSTVTDGEGRSIVFTYDANNNLTAVTDPNGNAYSFAYAGGNLTTVTNPDGGQWDYTYDGTGFLLSRTDPNDNTVTYTYDALHHIVSATDPEAKTRSLSFPQNSTNAVRSTTFTEKDGGIWSYTYDTSIGKLASKTDPYNATTSYTYDNNLNVLTKTEPVVGTTTYTYDLTGNMLTMTNPLNQTTSYTYNSFGQILTSIGPQGTTTNTYDTAGNLLSTTDPAGAITNYTYDGKGNPITITNPGNQTTTITYTAGLPASITDPTGAATQFSYDNNGNMLTKTDPAGNVTTYVYDAMNHLVKIIDPLNNVTTYTYDNAGNRTAVIDANSNTTAYSYNYQGKVTAAKDALGNITTYTYGPTGCPSCGGGVDKLTSLADAKGQTTSYQYDLDGRLIQETDPLQKTTKYGYDPAGNLTLKTDANNVNVTYSYDALKRLTQKTYPDSTTMTNAYDAAGRVQTMANNNISYTYAYDADNRVNSVTDSRGYAISYQYDVAGKRTQMTLLPGSPSQRAYKYAYDNASRIQSISSTAGTFTFGYDATGRRTLLAYPNQITANYSYDSAGRLLILNHQAGGQIIAGFNYTLDNVGNRTATSGTANGAYLYDNIYHLLQNAAPAGIENFSYDAVGNRLTGPGPNDTGYLYNASNEMVQGRKLQYAYDNNGNQNMKIVPNATDRSWTQTWDYENRLVKMQKIKGAEQRTVTFTYDPYGRRIGKQLTTVIDGVTTTGTWSYLYDNKNIVLEVFTDGTGGVTQTFYTHSPNIDEPLALERNGQHYYYHADGLGSISTITDTNKNIMQSYTYDSFGMAKPSTSFTNSYTYTGREWDKETGLYYYRARYYDPMEGRFISKDSKSFAGGDVNLYGYVKNNPIGWTDPNGLEGVNKTTSGFQTCVQSCISTNYGESFDIARDLTPLGLMDLVQGVFNEVTGEIASDTLKNLSQEGAFADGDITASIAAANKAAAEANILSPLSKTLCVASKASLVLGALSGGYVAGAYTYCAATCASK